MYISLDWISEYVDLTGLQVNDIVNRLTLATAEVEGTKEIRRFVKGVLVGEIKTVEKLSGKLTFCSVDCGAKTYTTVCGAPNVQVGLKSAFAPTGTVLAGNKTITEGEHNGKLSQGILCSVAELGLSNWHEIIFEIPDTVKTGSLLSDYIPERDTLIEIDNKSLTHRPDLWGHYGFAREFAAIFHRELKALPQLDLSQYNHLPAYPLKVEDTENCPCYGCIEFQSHGTVPSPLYIQRRLHALGLRSYNLLVDATNYVNWEIAQPTHAFDAEKIGGIAVKKAGDVSPPISEFQTLDGQKRKILPEDLLIWGGNNDPNNHSHKAANSIRPVALAGIMGGLETEVTETTTKLLLESANFKSARIRKTAGRLDLRTDASQRYEKSQPPSNVKVGVARILKIIEDAGAGLNVLSRFSMDGDLQDEIRCIEITWKRLETLAGIALSKEKVSGILESLGFGVEYLQTSDGLTLKVGVPPFRGSKDISIPEDIVEEVLRVYGYDNIEPVMPAVSVKPLYREKSLAVEETITRILSSTHNFLETHNSIWFNDLWLKQINFEPVGATLVLKNPTSPETSRLRTILLPNLLALIPKNRPYRDAFNLFEKGRTFLSVGKDRECLETHHLAGIAFQRSGSLDELTLSAKAALTDIFTQLGIDAAFRADSLKSADSVLPDLSGHFFGDSMRIDLNGQSFGQFGVLSKELLNKICPEGGQVVWFEIDIDKLLTLPNVNVRFAAPPQYPLSWMDFSLVWNEDDGFDKLETILGGFTNPLMIRREFITLYKGKGLAKGTASYSFRYWVGADDRTLSGEEIETFRAAFLKFVQEKGIALRA